MAVSGGTDGGQVAALPQHHQPRTGAGGCVGDRGQTGKKPFEIAQPNASKEGPFGVGYRIFGEIGWVHHDQVEAAPRQRLGQQPLEQIGTQGLHHQRVGHRIGGGGGDRGVIDVHRGDHGTGANRGQAQQAAATAHIEHRAPYRRATFDLRRQHDGGEEHGRMEHTDRYVQG